MQLSTQFDFEVINNIKSEGVNSSLYMVKDLQVGSKFILKQIELLSNISNLCFFGTIGYASHLFLGDLFTKSGIPILYPLSDKKFSLGFLRVGGFLSNILESLFILLLVAIIIFTLIKI